MLVGLDLGEVGSAEIEGGLELGVLGLEEREFGGEREELVLEERAGLLGGDGGGVGVSPQGIELYLEVADEGVGPLRHRGGVVAEAGEILVGEEERHGDLSETNESGHWKEGKIRNLKRRKRTENKKRKRSKEFSPLGLFLFYGLSSVDSRPFGGISEHEVLEVKLKIYI